MGIYVPHGHYRLYEFATRYYANTEVEIIETASGADIRFRKFNGAVGEVTVSGSIRLVGEDIRVVDGEIVSGEISTIQFYAFDFEYYAGEIQELNWTGSYFQTLISDTYTSSFMPLYYALTGAVEVVRGDSSSGSYDNSVDYPATDIHLGGGDDTYRHYQYGETPASIIDGGEGQDYFYPGRPGPVVIDVANERFVDYYGIEHVIRNFESFQGSEASDLLIGAMDRPNILFGSQGNDRLYGGNLDDRLAGGPGSDTILAYDGNDTITGSANDYVDGGDGIDTYIYERYTTGTVYIDMENSEDNANYAYGTVLVNIENLGGSEWYDTMLGDGEDNVIETFGRDDVLNGRGGNDTLDGGDGNDNITGGQGSNRLIGGLGADTFHFETLDAADTIVDYESGLDSLNFELLADQYDLISVRFGDEEFTRITCFQEKSQDALFLTAVQVGDNVEFYASSNGFTSTGFDPLVTLIGVDADALSSDDFIF